METKNPYGGEPGPNPKDLQGIKKPPLHLVPASSIIYEAMAFLEGASKYDPFNWRGKPVKTSVYVAAAMRHLLAYWNRQEFAKEGTPHLGNMKACAGILIDAGELGNLIDDRPLPGVDLDELSDKFAPLIAQRMREWADRIEREAATFQGPHEPRVQDPSMNGDGLMEALAETQRNRPDKHVDGVAQEDLTSPGEAREIAEKFLPRARQQPHAHEQADAVVDGFSDVIDELMGISEGVDAAGAALAVKAANTPTSEEALPVVDSSGETVRVVHKPGISKLKGPGRRGRPDV